MRGFAGTSRDGIINATSGTVIIINNSRYLFRELDELSEEELLFTNDDTNNRNSKLYYRVRDKKINMRIIEQ